MQSLKGLSTALMVLLPICALTALVGAVALIQRANFLDRFIDGDISFGRAIREGNDADNLVGAGFGLYGLAALATTVVFIVWQYRHAQNAEALGQRGGLGPGWAIGGWFIPLANAILAPMQLFQSSKHSDSARRGPGIVVIWMIAFALGFVVMMAGFGGFNELDDEGNLVFTSVDDVRDAARGDRVAAAGFVITMAAAGLAMVMVNQLTNRQTDGYQSGAAQPRHDPMAGASFGGAPSAPPGAYPAPQPGMPSPPSPPPPGPGSTPPSSPDDGGPAWPAPPG